MVKIIMIILTLIMVLATDSKYNIIETTDIYNIDDINNNDTIRDKSYPV